MNYLPSTLRSLVINFSIEPISQAIFGISLNIRASLIFFEYNSLALNNNCITSYKEDCAFSLTYYDDNELIENYNYSFKS